MLFLTRISLSRMCVCVCLQWRPVSSYPSSQYGVCSHLPEERSAAATWTPAAGHQDREWLQELQSVRKHWERQREQWCLQVSQTNTHTGTHLCFQSAVVSYPLIRNLEMSAFTEVTNLRNPRYKVHVFLIQQHSIRNKYSGKTMDVHGIASTHFWWVWVCDCVFYLSAVSKPRLKSVLFV